MVKKVSDVIYEEMTMASAKDVSRVAMHIMNELQTEKVPNQMLGVAALMCLMEEQYGVRTVEALNVADNIIQDQGNYSDFQGIKYYMKNVWNI